MRRLETSSLDGNVGFQIAPMIDVVFVIMLFFMVMAGSVKVEKELNSKLPGVAATAGPTDFVDEQIITISETGDVALNEEQYGAPGDSALARLKSILMRLKQNGDAAKSKVLVTIISDPRASYSRTIDVLNALSAAAIGDVTFTVSEEEP